MQWQEVLADPSLQDLPYKIELNERGKIEMSPASFLHSLLPGKLARLLGNQLDGEVFTELAIQTRQGVRVPDVAWATKEYVAEHINEICASAAPEICVEIISQSNSSAEMEVKTALFLESGATEVWLIDESGNARFFNEDGQIPTSGFGVKIDRLLP